MAIIKLMPPRVPLMDPRTGLITREWYAFFQALFERVGGTISPGIPEIHESVDEAAGVAELQAMMLGLNQGAMLNPPPLMPAIASGDGMGPPNIPPAVSAPPMDQDPPQPIQAVPAPESQHARLENLEAAVRRLQQEIESLKQG